MHLFKVCKEKERFFADVNSLGFLFLLYKQTLFPKTLLSLSYDSQE